jgi:tight adherence protein B
VKKFNVRFPDAIELMVRGLRSGLPISETIGIVGTEFQGPISEEFSAVSDKMKIGRTMEVSLQETADRLGTPEFQFFVISLAIQRETGGNLAETLSNLADVLRKRAQMKLKIKAMSSSQGLGLHHRLAALYRLRLIYSINPGYMGDFFTDQRLMIAGIAACSGCPSGRHHGQDDQLRNLTGSAGFHNDTGKRTLHSRHRRRHGRHHPGGGPPWRC